MPESSSRTNQEVADAIVSSYEDDPSSLDIGEMLHPDVVTYDWMSPGEVFRGADQFNEVFSEKASLAFPDSTEEIQAKVFDGSSLVLFAHFRGTFAADYYGLKPNGGPLSYEIIDRWEIEDGKIVRVYFAANTRTAYEQLLA